MKVEGREMRIRVSVTVSDDRKADLKLASTARQVLSRESCVWEDQEHPLRGIHRDDHRRCYFEFATDDVEQVQRVIAGLPFANRLEVTLEPPPPGEGCRNCGNIAGPVLPSVCPNCDFRDISPCPNSDCPRREVPRQAYVRVGAHLFRCPACQTLVRLRFNEPMFRTDGTFNPPLVVADLAEVMAAHEVR
jgi:hypothetical protein